MSRNHNGRFYQLFIACIDLALLHVGFLIAYWLHDGFVPESSVNVSLYLLSAAGLLSFYLFDLYSDFKRKKAQHLVYLVVISLLAYSFVLLCAGFWGGSFPMLQEHSLIFKAFVLQSVLLVSFRLCIWYLIRLYSGRKNVLIVGKNENESLQLAIKFLNHDRGWFTLIGFLPVAQRSQLEKDLANVHAVLLGPGVSKEATDEIVSLCTENGKEILIVPEMYELFISTANTQQIDDMLVFSIEPPKLSRSSEMAKRLFDVLVSGIILVMTSPIFLLFYFLIPATSKGPAFYKQERLGLHGKAYQIYKFRSMKQDAEKLTGPTLAADHDPRITKIGHLLRATRMDELPQIINVLKGEMSIVGPRPEREFFIRQFSKQVPNYFHRLSVKPGITGLAQVMANYTTTVEDKLRYDLMYVRNLSFTMDLKILLQTIRVVLQRDQAQGVKEVEAQQPMRSMGSDS
ncbi:sugar transferase [Fictibacillus sp. KU28468]|uniref:sugar transferase n=1 Tax=Fictibacillus sp. KU28468 TaxID=2991053 RepID=UPI00223D29C8|nr:sugar transferase [Fictibacillus sp. KU28468]UZJ79383.1 sugar transferase [Fictibacillus sp. KU28468]